MKHPTNEEQKKEKDIVVTVILTESTSNTLELDLPHLEDLKSDSESAVCTIRPETTITNSRKTSGFLSSWLSENEEKDLSREVAYFSNHNSILTSDESVTSLEYPESKKIAPGTRSASSLDQKLRPVTVYARPLVTVNSLAHQDNITSEANNIYISIMKSNENIMSSDWINVCRICHGGESFGNLLSVCQCRGSIALTHRKCLERWLKESATSHCELCQYHFQLLRRSKYGLIKSIFIFLRHPGEHLGELLFDSFSFLIYTPTAIASTYMLILLCESITKAHEQYSKGVYAHLMTSLAVIGMAVIDFTYSSWLMGNLQKHVLAWREWYRSNCEIKLLLPEKNGSSSSSCCSELSELLENEVD